jgi:iron complex outermembrane recepter protein
MDIAKIRLSKQERRNVASVGLLLLAAAPCAPAIAQEGGAQLEEVVVSAQKRDESLQDVPIAITAFTAEQLAESGVGRSMDLSMTTPGLIFGEAGRDGQIFIRGVGSTRLTGSGIDPSSSTYIDGVYRSRPYNALIDIMDLQRVEVLRGPQGTLYGRNSTGGAIKYVSSDPAAEFGAKFTLAAGNYDMQKAMAQVDIPVIKDQLLVRVAGLRTRHDGYTKNLSRPGETFGRQNETAGRLTVKYIASENLDFVLHAASTHDDSDQTALKQYVDPAGRFASSIRLSNPREVYTDYYPRTAPVQSQAWDLTVNWKLERADFTSITGYNKSKAGPYSGDLDSTELPGANDGTGHLLNGYLDTGKTLSQEFVLASKSGGDFEWLGGLYYLHDDNFTRAGLSVALFNLPFDQFEGTGKSTAYAAFGNLSYRATEKLRLNLGLRYNDEKKEMARSRYVNGVLTAGPVFAEKSWSAFTYKAGADYFVNDDVMLYASASKGFKSGAFNAGSFEAAVNPEHIDAIEAGIKTTLLERRLRLNAALFQYDYQDLQVQALDPANLGREILRNAANATIKGAEIEATALLGEHFQADLGIALLDATYDDFLTLDDTTNASVNLKGNKLPNSPKYTLNLGLGYNVPFANGSSLKLHADYYHSEEKFFNENNSRVNALQPAFDLVNARITYAPSEASWNVALYGRNLGDELVFSRTTISRALLGNGYLAYLQPPRTYGIEFEIRL